MLYYTVVLGREPDSAGYTAWAPALPGCRARGETVEGAIAGIREAIQSRLRRIVEDGRPLPEDPAWHVILAEVSAPRGVAGPTRCGGPPPSAARDRPEFRATTGRRTGAAGPRPAVGAAW